MIIKRIIKFFKCYGRCWMCKYSEYHLFNASEGKPVITCSLGKKEDKK